MPESGYPPPGQFPETLTQLAYQVFRKIQPFAALRPEEIQHPKANHLHCPCQKIGSRLELIEVFPHGKHRLLKHVLRIDKPLHGAENIIE